MRAAGGWWWENDWAFQAEELPIRRPERVSTFKEQIKKTDKFSIKNAVEATGETFLGNLGKGELKTKEIFNNAIYHMTEKFCFE